MSQIKAYQERIDEFLSSILDDAPPQKPADAKIIHDSVWGTNTFHPWEVALIDCPLLQRLRRIHQTGLAFLVFPTATHTRFEHSLGVTTLVENLVNHLNSNKKNSFIDEEERYNLRLSALLHDVGHSFFSHVSEMVYARMPVFQELLTEISNEYDGLRPKGHEIFSFFMVKSRVFQKYFAKIVSNCIITKDVDSIREYLNKDNWDRLAGWIIGYSKDPKEKYLAEIINGPFDCDKLDYLARDAKFAGPVIVYDIDRFYYTLDTLKTGDVENLTVTLSGITALEQILISRMMMFSYIYHHHKVRSSEAMIKRLCFDLMEEEMPDAPDRIKIKLSHPVDFLKYTDEVLLSSYSDLYNIPHHSKTIINELINRSLWVRGNFVSDFNLEKGSCHPSYTSLEEDLHVPENIKELKAFKEKIISEVKSIDRTCPIESRDIWIDVPKAPNADEVSRVKIKKSHSSSESVPLIDVFPIAAWIDAYKAQKWKSHIFCKKGYQNIIYEASKKVFLDTYKMEIQPYTKSFCKIEP
jgi:HD superfamily phosphohydrolase